MCIEQGGSSAKVARAARREQKVVCTQCAPSEGKCAASESAKNSVFAITSHCLRSAMSLRQCIRNLLRQYVIHPALRVRFSRRRLALAGLAFTVIFLNKVFLQGSLPVQRPRLEQLRARRGSLLAASLAFRPMPAAFNIPASSSPPSLSIWETENKPRGSLGEDVAQAAHHIPHTTLAVSNSGLPFENGISRESEEDKGLTGTTSSITHLATESHIGTSVCSHDYFAVLFTSFLSRDCLHTLAAKKESLEPPYPVHCTDLKGLAVLLWRCWSSPEKSPLL